MMCRMTAVTQGDQIRRFVTTPGGAWNKMMNIDFIGMARLPAFDAPQSITSKDALSGFAPILFDCQRHDNLAFLRIATSTATLCDAAD